MAFCKNCGANVGDGIKFCPTCGTEIESFQSSQTSSVHNEGDKVTNAFNNFNNTTDTTASFDKADIEQNKVMGILSYFSWLVLIPIFAAKNSKYARFHANQGLVLAIGEIGWALIDGILSSILRIIFASKFWGIYSLLTTVLDLVYWVFTIVAIIGIVNAVNGKAKELPLIGKIKILK